MQASDSNGNPGLWGRLTKGTFNYGIGSVLPPLVGFLLIPLYTHYLDPSDYGILELATVFGAFLTILMRFGVPGAVARFYYEYQGDRLRNYLTSIFRCVVISSSATLILMLISGPFVLERLLPGLLFFPYGLIVVVTSFAAGNSDLQRRIIQAREQSTYSAKLSLAFASVGIGLSVLFVAAFEMGAVGMLLANMITSLAFACQALHYMRSDITGSYQKDTLLPSLNYSLGVLPHHLMGCLTPLVTRALLSGMNSLSAVGLFSLAYRFTSPLNIVRMAFETAFFPIYVSERKKSTEHADQHLAATIHAVWFATIIASLAMYLFAPPCIILMTPPSYHNAASIVPILACAFPAQVIYMLFSAEIFYQKKTSYIPIITGISTLVNLLVTASTVTVWGAHAVAWALTAGHAAAAILTLIISTRLTTLPFDWRQLARAALIGAAIASLVQMIPSNTPEFVSLLTGCMQCLLYMFLMYILGDKTAKAVVGIARSKALLALHRN